MSKYLDALKRQDFSELPTRQLPELPKAPIGSYGSGQVAGPTKYRSWRVHFPSADPVEVTFTPDAALHEVAALYPGATCDPLPDPVQCQATPEQAAELRQLVGLVAARWPDDERAEAIAVALADPVDALTCWRALAAEQGVSLDKPKRASDDRRTCRQCANLAAGGRCLAAWRGESLGVGMATGREYRPDPARMQRCAAYSPGANDPRQSFRSGTLAGNEYIVVDALNERCWRRAGRRVHRNDGNRGLPQRR